MDVRDPQRTAVIGWGLLHGLTSLYLSGHLGKLVNSNDAFMHLVEEAIQSLFSGFRGGKAIEAGKPVPDRVAERVVAKKTGKRSRAGLGKAAR
jgi:hypothetical protein